MNKARIPNKVKWAAALLTMRHDVGGRLVPIFTFSQAKTLSADEIIGMFEHDHWPILEAFGGPTEPWNITPRLKAEHRRKTAKVDIPAIAKSKRIAKSNAAHAAKLNAKLMPVDVRGDMADAPARRPQKRAWPKRHFPGSKADKAAGARRR